MKGKNETTAKTKTANCGLIIAIATLILAALQLAAGMILTAGGVDAGVMGVANLCPVIAALTAIVYIRNGGEAFTAAKLFKGILVAAVCSAAIMAAGTAGAMLRLPGESADLPFIFERGIICGVTTYSITVAKTLILKKAVPIISVIISLILIPTLFTIAVGNLTPKAGEVFSLIDCGIDSRIAVIAAALIKAAAFTGLACLCLNSRIAEATKGEKLCKVMQTAAGVAFAILVSLAVLCLLSSGKADGLTAADAAAQGRQIRIMHLFRLHELLAIALSMPAAFVIYMAAAGESMRSVLPKVKFSFITVIIILAVFIAADAARAKLSAPAGDIGYENVQAADGAAITAEGETIPEE